MAVARLSTGGLGSLKHTFGSGDVISAGGYFTIVDSNGSGISLTGVGSPAVFSDSPGIGIGTDKSLILYNPGTTQFIILAAPAIGSFLASDISDFSSDFGAIHVGSGEIVVAGTAGQSWQRDADGSDTFVAGDPTPGSVNCFLAGTSITTPDDMIAVEDLKVGDPILTANGKTIPVKWVGRQVVSTRFGPAERLMPVRVAAGALDDGVPLRDLTLTADHSLLIDSLLINAGALVNGGSINWVPLSELGDSYTVYHIETEAHDIILANGAQAETFIDNVSRRVFDNFVEFEALYGDVPETEELDYPRAMSARQVPQTIKQRLAIKSPDDAISA